MSTEEEVPIHRPPFRQWELGPENDRYDNLVAAPSDDDLMKMWIGWLAITSFVAIFTSTVFLGVLVNRKARNNPFNLYLLFLMVPDIFFSGSCVITCILNVETGTYWSASMCQFQSFYSIFGIGANAWLNAVVSWQLHTMLKSSNVGRKYTAPSRKRVALHSLLVYLWAAFVASWPIWGIGWLPHQTKLYSGEACAPQEYSRSSTLFFFFAFFPCFVGIPLAYVCYVLYDIMKNKLLPPTGKRRLLAIYFFRLVVAFVLMWIPALVLIFIVGSWISPWATWTGGSWSHLQVSG
jgi:hypothetical protein